MIERVSDRIILTLEGSKGDDGHVRLSDFLEEIKALREALIQTERSVFNRNQSEMYFRIVDASHSSPFRMVIQGVPNTPKRAGRAEVKKVVRTFKGCVRSIQQKKRPRSVDLAALESYRDLGTALNRHVEHIGIEDTRGKVIPIDRAFREKLADVIGPDEWAFGSISGRFEKLNLHNTNRFEIFPTVGPKKIVCTFDERDRAQILQGVDRYVTVVGRIFYKQWSKFPHKVHVSKMDVHELESGLPTLEDLRGCSPDATEGVSSEDYVRRIRDEDW